MKQISRRRRWKRRRKLADKQVMINLWLLSGLEWANIGQTWKWTIKHYLFVSMPLLFEVFFFIFRLFFFVFNGMFLNEASYMSYVTRWISISELLEIIRLWPVSTHVTLSWFLSLVSFRFNRVFHLMLFFFFVSSTCWFFTSWEMKCTRCRESRWKMKECVITRLLVLSFNRYQHPISSMRLVSISFDVNI